MKYFIAIGDKQEGPFELGQLQKLTFDSDTMVWKEGMKEWVEILHFDELKDKVKISKSKDDLLIPPALPIVNSNSADNKESRNKQKEFKKQVAQSRFNEKKDELLKSFKSNLFILLITFPLSIGSYFLIAYLEGGFEAITLKQQYEPYINSKLNRATVDYKNYDKVPVKYRIQLQIESRIEELMDEHLKENELNPSMYQSLSEYHNDMNQKGDQGFFSFKQGTVALDYSPFLDDRIETAFKKTTILKTVGIFIFSTIVFFIFQFFRQKKSIKPEI